MKSFSNSGRRDRTPTIWDVARRAGVSPSTVSRILTGTTPVSAAKQEKVRQAIRRLGFRPNAGLVRAIHPSLGVPLYAQAELSGVHTGLYERAGDWFLFATNMNPNDVQTRVRLDGIALPPLCEVTDLWTGERRDMTLENLVIAVPCRSGGAWRIKRRRY